MSILLTGANGFVGQQLLFRLVDSGYYVVAYDLTHSNDLYNNSMIQVITGDISTGENFDKIKWDNIQLVFHLAAAGVKAAKRNWDDCISVNLNGTKMLINAIQKVPNPPKLIYPRTFYEDFVIEYEALQRNPYFCTKYLATKIVEDWIINNPNSKVLFTKIFQAYGPGDDRGNVLSYTLHCLRNRTPALLSSGKALRDWIYIEDLVENFLFCVDYSFKKTEYFDFGTGILTSVKEMAYILADLLDCPSDLLCFNEQLDREDTNIIASASNFVPGWKSRYSIKKGLETFIKNS